jgi:hypothetical protein
MQQWEFRGHTIVARAKWKRQFTICVIYHERLLIQQVTLLLWKYHYMLLAQKDGKE